MSSGPVSEIRSGVVLLRTVGSERDVQDKAIAVEPQGLERIVKHNVPEQRHANCRCSHRGPAVPTLVGLNKVGGEASDSGEDELLGRNLQSLSLISSSRRLERTQCSAYLGGGTP